MSDHVRLGCCEPREEDEVFEEADISGFSLRFSRQNDSFDILTAEGNCGWRGLVPWISLANEPGADEVILTQGEDFTFSACWGTGKISASLSCEESKYGWITLGMTISNTSGNDVSVMGYGFDMIGKDAGVVFPNERREVPVFAHTDNLRREKLPECRPVIPFIRSMPEATRTLGLPGSGSVPCLAFGKMGDGLWLLEGAMTGRSDHLEWDLFSGNRICRRSRFAWTGMPGKYLPSGESLSCESIGFRVFEGTPSDIFSTYYKEVASRIEGSGKSSQLSHLPVYCTWNFGTLFNLDEAKCFQRIEIVSKLQPGGIFQLDHAYQPPNSEGGIPPELDCFYPTADGAWDINRFPSGPKGFVRKCLECGLKPSLWWSPRIERRGTICKQHPSWVQKDRSGEPIDVGHYLLDPSVPEVRGFLESCLEIIIHDWGFQGIKLDFFSYMFDHPDAVFLNGGTGMEWKRWLLTRIRSLLGPEGYFLHCISCPSGNPWLADVGPDAYRAGMDIHDGSWGEHLRNVHWMLPAATQGGKSTWFPNIDSCMGHPDIPSVERRSRLAFAYLSNGMMEFSGPVEAFSEEMLRDYQHMVSRCDQGSGFEVLGEDAFYGQPYADVILRRHSRDSRTGTDFGLVATLGLFNWTDKTRNAEVLLPDFLCGLEMSDFWTGDTLGIAGVGFAQSLSPRSHFLIDFHIPNSAAL